MQPRHANKCNSSEPLSCIQSDSSEPGQPNLMTPFEKPASPSQNKTRSKNRVCPITSWLDTHDSYACITNGNTVFAQNMAFQSAFGTTELSALQQFMTEAYIYREENDEECRALLELPNWFEYLIIHPAQTCYARFKIGGKAALLSFRVKSIALPGEEKAYFLSLQDFSKTLALRQKSRELMSHTRLALMGEMLSVITHQWRQPLTSLCYQLSNIKMMSEQKKLSPKSLIQKVKKSQEFIHYMSTTIDDFRGFLSPRNEHITFRLSDPIKQTLNLFCGISMYSDIKFRLKSDTDCKKILLTGNKNEFQQALVCILKNGIDAINECQTRNGSGFKGKIIIRIEPDKECVLLRIRDNGTGISEENLSRIFDPKFTTKGNREGTGIGLSMAKTIIEERLLGTITAGNHEKGAEFLIALPICMIHK